jgi:hypothetical protein
MISSELHQGPVQAHQHVDVVDGEGLDVETLPVRSRWQGLGH